MMLSKVEARSLAKGNVLGFSAEFKTNSSKSVQNHVSSFLREVLLESTQSKNIAIYQADSWELKIDGIRDAFPNLNFYFPKVAGDTLEFILPESFEKGFFQILEPVGNLRLPVSLMDFIFVPGLGYGRKGHRLGRGKGFYDKSLSEFPKQKIAGVCFFENADLQFSWEPHDISVGILFTEKGRFSFLD